MNSTTSAAAPAAGPAATPAADPTHYIAAILVTWRAEGNRPITAGATWQVDGYQLANGTPVRIGAWGGSMLVGPIASVAGAPTTPGFAPAVAPSSAANVAPVGQDHSAKGDTIPKSFEPCKPDRAVIWDYLSEPAKAEYRARA